MIDPSRLERVLGYNRMVGGFGTVRVAKLDNSLVVAVKEMRIGGDDDDRARFAIVRRTIEARRYCLTIHRDLRGS